MKISEKNIICITCPVGCEISAKGTETQVTEMTGHKCKRGSEYAKDEFLHPKRILTSTVKITDYDYPIIPVRSNIPLPKDKLFDCMEIICRTHIKAPVKRGDIIIKNILNTGADIIVSTNS